MIIFLLMIILTLLLVIASIKSNIKIFKNNISDIKFNLDQDLELNLENTFSDLCAAHNTVYAQKKKYFLIYCIIAFFIDIALILLTIKSPIISLFTLPLLIISFGIYYFNLYYEKDLETKYRDIITNYIIKKIFLRNK